MATPLLSPRLSGFPRGLLRSFAWSRWWRPSSVPTSPLTSSLRCLRRMLQMSGPYWEERCPSLMEMHKDKRLLHPASDSGGEYSKEAWYHWTKGRDSIPVNQEALGLRVWVPGGLCGCGQDHKVDGFPGSEAHGVDLSPSLSSRSLWISFAVEPPCTTYSIMRGPSTWCTLEVRMSVQVSGTPQLDKAQEHAIVGAYQQEEICKCLPHWFVQVWLSPP